MAQTPTDTQTSGSLQDFSFDGDNEWFGIKPTELGTSTDKVIKEVKGKGGTDSPEATNIEDDDDDSSTDEDEKVTFFDTDSKDEDDDNIPVKTTKKKSVSNDDVDDTETQVVEEDDIDDVDEASKKKTKKKPEVVATTNDEDDPKFFLTLASELKDRKILQSVEVEADKEYTEDEFFELMDKDVESRIQEAFEAFAQNLDDDGKAFIKFKKEGGKTSDFFTHFVSPFEIEEFDPKDETHIQKTLSYYLTAVENLDAEELADRLSYLKDSGKEKAYAAKYFNLIQEDKEEKQEAIVKAQEANNKKRQENVLSFNTELDKTLKATKAVGAFSITPEDQKQLGAFMTKPTEKVGSNRFVPKMQIELARILKAETPQDKADFILLAKLIRDKFDTTDLIAKVKTEVTKDAKSNLRKVKSGSVRAASAGGTGNKQLTDYFN